MPRSLAHLSSLGSRARLRGLVGRLALLAILVALAPRPLAAQDYGSTSGWGLVVDVSDASGLVLGVRHYLVRYGYRRVTWETRLQTRLMASFRGGLGADVVLMRQLAPEGVVLSLDGGASRRLRSYRFYGFGNDTPLIDPERALVRLDEAWLGAAATVPLAAGSVVLGPAFRFVRPHPHERGPLVLDDELGSKAFAQLGVTGSLDLSGVDDPLFPRDGRRLLANVSAHPPLLDAEGWFGRAEVELRSYLPLVAGGVLATRLRGAAALGPFPAHEAVFLGGAETLRGHRRQRYAGDAALLGSAELRMPFWEVPFFDEARLGALAFLDVGRVFEGGDLFRGWHGARGIGLWYGSPLLTVTAVYASGEQKTAHLYLGLPF